MIFVISTVDIWRLLSLVIAVIFYLISAKLEVNLFLKFLFAKCVMAEAEQTTILCI